MADINRRAMLAGTAAAVLNTKAGVARAGTGVPARWSVGTATAWYGCRNWLLGNNFIPSTAVNQLEMWQAASFDEAGIDRELGWASALGMNAARVFLHDLVWYQDAAGFRSRIDRLLAIADRHGIRVMLVLFDSCWDPYPHLGPQPPPVPGVHNSRWVQGPGAVALQDRSQHARLRAYVEDVVGTFGSDDRVLAWDVWNEPDNTNASSYGRLEPPHKVEIVLDLLSQVFAWARSVRPAQPLTSGVWRGDWSADEKLNPMERIQLSQSDVISFHNYGWPEDFEKRVRWLQRYRRPILCTEYMARPLGSTFDEIAPLAKKLDVAAINWGLVAGKTQTWLPWDSWQHPYVDTSPLVWFHDVFHGNGLPDRQYEADLLRCLVAF